ncbi:MAG: type II toxin-antitoxin system RelE/ParE family toxin [Alphaproteobacteria bacterium]|nr:type II toxin-antitoxin system RelE/ParE family toxin [Alphaproteobacteria bacterium]
MPEGFKTLPAAFYRTQTGHEPVREWLKQMPAEDRKIVGDDIRDCEFAWPIGLPLCRPMSGTKGLWEVRSNLTGGRIARVLFVVNAGRIVLLHGFMKKSRKTPARELDLGVKRMKEVQRHG